MLTKEELHRRAQRKFYQQNSSTIIKNKTLVKVRQCGRMPRESTLVLHGIDQESLKRDLLTFAKNNPDCNAAKRILRKFTSPKLTVDSPVWIDQDVTS